MDAIEFTKKQFRNLADDGFFVNASLFVDSTLMTLIEKCNYLSSILSSEGSPIYRFESFLEQKQIFSPKMSLIPNAFLEETVKSPMQDDSKAIVLLSSPFATIKDAIHRFLSNITNSKVCFYFTADCELHTQNNLSGVEFGSNLDKLIIPLPYITELLKSSSSTIEAYSLGINAIPLLSDSYLKTNIFQLMDPTLQVEAYNRSDDNWIVSILRFLYTFDFNVTDYIFYLGLNSKNVAKGVKQVFKTRSDNNGYALVIADHSIDLLSVLRHSNCTDLESFLRCLHLLPSDAPSESCKEYTVLETEEELILKEWIKREGGKDVYRSGSFIESTCDYLEDLCETKNVSYVKREVSVEYLEYLNNLVLDHSIHEDYFETTSLIHRLIRQLRSDGSGMCFHDFFHSIDFCQDIQEDLLSFYTKPCSLCGHLPTLGDLVNRILLLAFEGKIMYCSQEQIAAILLQCCLKSEEDQIHPINRILSSESCKAIRSGNQSEIKTCCDQLCSKDATLMTLIERASIIKQHIHSDWFLSNPGHFLLNIMRCADEPSNATDDTNVKCSTDIYTTKEPKPQSPNQGYFSFLRSFISMEHESIVKDREGIIIVSLDGIYDRELIELLSDMKKRNDTGVRDLVLVSHQFGKVNPICDLL